jgi:hypothetical protein
VSNWPSNRVYSRFAFRPLTGLRLDEQQPDPAPNTPECVDEIADERADADPRDGAVPVADALTEDTDEAVDAGWPISVA